MKTPYIGITDFMTRLQAAYMLAVFQQNRKLAKHKLMVGVMISRKSLNGLPHKWQKAFPATKDIASIFMNDPLAFNTIHYADNDNLDQESNFRRTIEACGQNLHAMQFDMAWPDHEVLKRLKRDWPRMELILQIGTRALEQTQKTPDGVISRLNDYGEALDFVLLDQSMGRGRPMESETLRPYIQKITQELPHLGITVAGGLGPKTVHLAEPLIQAWPDISLDAQGQLRDSGTALDPINWEMATEYIVNALELFNRYL